ncbi:MAG: amidohydrolase family protein [Wenzhouxiangellaceae bacterium]
MMNAIRSSCVCIVIGMVWSAAFADKAVLINDVYLFDGGSTERDDIRSNVLVVGNRIQSISTSAIEVDAAYELTVIDGAGKTLMPGLIDAHSHITLTLPTMMDAMAGDLSYVHAISTVVAESMLMRGFTAVRDVGGASFGLRRAIEEGRVPGPRIVAAGAMISQTGGHGDFRMRHEVPRSANAPLAYSEQAGVSMIADGADEVLRRAREQLMLGAHFLKLMAGGGVTSLYDPLDATQYTPAEFSAAVQAAENWGTYVTVHAYTSRAVQMAINSGVRVIEHGQLVDEETVRLMVEHDVWWSLQPFLDNELANPQKGAARLKQLQVAKGTDRAYELARAHGVKVAFGTDLLFTGTTGSTQTARMVSLQRWYSAGEILQMATAHNGELLALSGPRYPYPGPVGVIEPEAMADLLLVDGDPTEDIELLLDPEVNLALIIKNGRIYKNTLNN